MEGRNDPRSIEWAKEIKRRDNYICQLCKKYGVPLHSHHLYSFDKFVNKRYDVNNGICLCTRCHNNFHDIFGRGNNTPFQFDQFKKTFNMFRAAIEKLG